MQNSECIEIFESYLANEKKASANTLSSYLRDVRQLGEYLDIHHDAEITAATEEQLGEYIAWLKSNGKSVATVSRCIASIKCLFSYLCLKQLIAENPASKLVPDKGEHKLPQILSSREVDLLLEQPQCTDAKGYRDKAMLELLYATGIRVTELIDLDISDVNLTAGVVRCRSRDTADDRAAGRGIPLCKRLGRTHVPSGLLEDHEVLPEEGSYRQGHHAAYAAPLFRGASAGERRGYSRDPGDARTRGYLLDADLFPAREKAAQGRLQQSPSESLKNSRFAPVSR